jgi:Squalene-hopene cyclase C-terminal domain
MSYSSSTNEAASDRVERGTPELATSRGGGRPARRWRVPVLTRLASGWGRMLEGEYNPDTLRSVPSWGMSVLLHAFLLLLLALAIQIGRGADRENKIIQPAVVDTQLGDVVSLVPANRAGDPFTTNDSPDPPSQGLTADNPEIRLVGQPEIPGLVRFAPVMASPLLDSSMTKATPLSVKPAPRGRLGSFDMNLRLPEFSEAVTAAFTGRQGLTKAKLLRREGGTARSEKAVDDGLAWIVRHQRADGSWGLDISDQCEAEPCPPQRTRFSSDTAATGLALLPLMGAGHIHTVKSRYQDAVRRGLDWLVAHQQDTGDLFTGPMSMAYMYSHAIASMAICEAYGLSRDPALERPAHGAIDFIVAGQDPNGGGWRYSPGMPGDTSVFGWNIFALRSAHLAGIKVPGVVLKKCSAYLDSAATDKKRVSYTYLPGQMNSEFDAVMTAEALLGRQLLGWPRDFPALLKGVGMVSSHLQQSGERNIYYWYYATQLLHNMGGPSWERWNIKIREGLISTQDTGGACSRGSWDPFQPQPDTRATSAGRLYLTSLSILTLEVYYRYLPMYRTYDEDQANPKRAMKADDAPGDRPKTTGGEKQSAPAKKP